MTDSTDDPRELASHVVFRVVHRDAFSQVALDHALEGSRLSGRDRGLTAYLVYGTLTYLSTIDRLLDEQMSRGLSSVKPDVQCALRVACYQLFFLADTPAYAAIDSAVREVKPRRGSRVAGLVNAVLRNLDRKRAAIEARLEARTPTANALRWGVPSWLAERLTERLDAERADAVMAAFNRPTPVRLRDRDQDPYALCDALGQAGIDATPHPIAAHGVVLGAGSVRAVRDAVGDRAEVEDAGAQLVSEAILHPVDGPILDLCAGRGVKTVQLADLHDAPIVATDRDKKKLGTLRKRVDPDRVTTAVWSVPGPAPDAVTAAAPFGSVLVDAPCSALGTIGRHPEVRTRRAPEHISELVALQREMLDAAAPLVAPGGELVYAVCT